VKSKLTHTYKGKCSLQLKQNSVFLILNKYDLDYEFKEVSGVCAMNGIEENFMEDFDLEA